MTAPSAKARSSGSLSFDAIANAVCAAFPPSDGAAGVAARTTDNGQPFLLVPRERLADVARLLCSEPALRCDALMDLFGIDPLRYPGVEQPDSIAVVLLLWSHAHHHAVALRALAPRADCRVPTTSSVWPAALYFEREVFDLYGVTFTGHPSLQRIMTPDDWLGHPLRKDYVYPGDYHGVAHLRDGQHFESQPPRAGDPPPAAAKPTRGSHAP